MTRKSSWKVYLLLISSLTASLCSCTKSGGGGGDSSADDGARPPAQAGEFRTNCGTVVNGAVQNPVRAADGMTVAVRVTGPNMLAVSLPSGDVLVKLHSIDSPYDDGLEKAAMSLLQSLASGGAVFYPAGGAECTADLPGGGIGTFGQLFTKDGTSFSELLLEQGLAEVEDDPCGGEELTSCYEALLDNSDSKVAGELDRLLWKPVSDSNGRLAVHTGPYGTTVRVNGESGQNQGGGNGYGSLARFTRPGCSYGAARVEVLNDEGLPYTFNGQRFLVIPNGCGRYCFVNGNLAPCSKS